MKNKLYIYNSMIHNCKILWGKFLENIININPIILGIIIYMKSVIFLSILNGDYVYYIITYFAKIIFAPHLAIIFLIISFGFLFSNKKRTYILLMIDILISVLFVMDMSFWRSTGIFLSLKHLINPNLFNPLGKNIFNFRLSDLIFIFDIIIFLAILFINNNIKYESKRKIKQFIFIFMISIFTIFKFHYLLDKQNITQNKELLFKDSWVEQGTISNMSPLGFHIHDVLLTLNEKIFCNKLQKEGLSDVTKWIDENKENLSDNNYKGKYEGKNLIFIQVESLENMILNQKINGQEVTPNLNRLLKNGVYFNNIYEQNGLGSSSDCDLMVNTSVLPLMSEISFFNYPDIKFTTMSSLLKAKSYSTMSSHPEISECIGGFNWQAVHKVSLNFDNVYDSEQLHADNERIGSGLSDKSYLQAVGKKLENIKQPFFSYSITLTSHGDFSALPNKYKNLNLPSNLNGTILGNYFQSFRYTDEQIGGFIDYVENDLNLKNTVFVIYGDHTILHKAYHNQISNINTDETWWKDQEKKIPLIIYTQGQNGEVINTYGGQVDILPTIAYMMGVDRQKFESTTMGRVLVNTKRNSTITNEGTIKGEVRNNSEKEHLLNSYQISEKFIRGNYLEWLEYNNKS